MARRPPDSRVPVFFQERSTDEYLPPPRGAAELEAERQVRAELPEQAARVGQSERRFAASRRGTAAGLRALNAAAGGEFYVLPAEAEQDAAAADGALGGDEVVIDVQTHYVADRALRFWNPSIAGMYRAVRPEWWRGMDALESYDMAEYLRCVFLESETAVAVLSSGPGLDESRMLHNRELAGTRELFERLGASGRLLNHTVVHPNEPGELEGMERARDRYRPAGWKVYTIGHAEKGSFGPKHGWWLDDERVGIPFLERARALGVKLVCAHKGISAMVDNGSPRDVGPIARAFPDLDFVIYHSGYEFPIGDEPPEGPFTPQTEGSGVNRLVATLRDSGVKPGSNVCAELGTTWFCLIRKPLEAAHVLGKLLLAVGEDHVIWGSDSIWYGPTQPAIDAFRAFQIPAELRERYGYPELTRELKAKILGRNAARLYGIDLEAAGRRAQSDDLAWIRAAVEEWRARGTPSAD